MSSGTPLQTRSLRHNSLANLAGRAGTALLWLGVTPYVLARLGPERFAVWSLLFSITAYVAAFDLGIGSAVVRFVAKARATAGRRAFTDTLRGAVGLSMLWGAFWALALFVFRGWLSSAFHVPPAAAQETQDALGIFALVVWAMLPTQVLLAALQGLERFDLSNLCLLLGVGVQVTMLALGLSRGGGLVVAAWAALAGSLASAVLAALWLRAAMGRLPEPAEDRSPSWRELLQFAAALQVTTLLIVLQFQGGKMLLALLGNLRAVADYELAFRVATAAGAIPALMLGAAIPSATRAWEAHGPTEVTLLLRRLSRWVTAASVLCLGLLIVLADDLCRLWLGPGHEAVAVLLRLWAVAYAVNLVGGPATTVARAIGRPWLETLAAFLAVSFHLMLGLLWIPRFGAIGALAALIASFFIANAGFLAVFQRRTRLALKDWLSAVVLPRMALGALVVLASGFAAAAAAPRMGLEAGWLRGVLGAAFFAAAWLAAFAWVGDPRELWRMARNPAGDEGTGGAP